MPRDESGGLGGRLLQYLHEHPDAADTAHGIRVWWLGEQPAVTIAEVESALDVLVGSGVMTRIDRGEMPPVYRGARRDGRA
jgi:hypothetical protein